MGQRGSKQHDPLAFGYADYTQTPCLEETADANTSPEHTNNNMLPDYVLNHPELYKLEIMCKCTHTTAPSHHRTTASINTDGNGEWIVAAEHPDCPTCRQNKRRSFARQHLAKDLEYIDETYYADSKHYEFGANDTSNSISGESEPRTVSTTNHLEDYVYSTGGNNDNTESFDDEVDETIDENWGKITVGDATSLTARRTVALPETSSHQGGNVAAAAAFKAKSTTFTLDLSGRSLVKLSSGIGYLSNLTKLNLSNNQLSTLPKSIGYLSNLTVLNASRNQLETLPDTMLHLTKLKAMNICHNKITHLPRCLGLLPELIIIIANNNQIRWIPNELANLQQMISLNISNNPLQSLPAEIANIKSLRKLIAEGCGFQTEFINKRQHDPPTLFEQCARTIVQHRLALPTQLPKHIYNYLLSHQTCSYCHGPYFESFVTRGRFIERAAHQPIALEYRLCRAHWSDEQDRLLNLFSSSPSVVLKKAGLPESSPGVGGDTSSILSSVSHVGARKRSEIMSTTTSPDQKENNINESGLVQSASDYQYHCRQQHLASCNFPTIDSSHLNGIEQQLPLHQTMAGILPTSYHDDQQHQLMRTEHHPDIVIHGIDGTSTDQHYVTPISHPVPLHATPV
ncbi:hypothetical protein BCR42DRAFT_496876 [Absidia repens]|uniref:L domain-like protein n=1 Tax=Absidia repens TaxID=90262 RepID=A0A1X2HY19_9FUNG|nr:hypothetical protein BCR42DRAFT_496876 [Absidia repens]